MARSGDPIRPSSSHITNDGSPKRVFEREIEAAETANLIWQRTGRVTGYYLCSQRPDHWHIGSGLKDIRRKQ